MHGIVQLWDWREFDKRIYTLLSRLQGLIDNIPSYGRKKQILAVKNIVYQFIDAPYIKNIPLPSPYDNEPVSDMPIFQYIKALNAIIIAFNQYLHNYAMRIYTTQGNISTLTSIDPSFDLYQASILFTRANIIFCYEMLTPYPLQNDRLEVEKVLKNAIEEYKSVNHQSPITSRMIYEYIFSQDGYTLDVILSLMRFPMIESQQNVLIRRVMMLLNWFGDGIHDIDDVRIAGERVKKYVIEEKGFLGIIDDNVAYQYIYQANKEDKNQYFIIAIDMDNISQLVIYTEDDKRKIKGSDLKYIYSNHYLPLPFPYASFSMVPLKEIDDVINHYYNRPI